MALKSSDLRVGNWISVPMCAAHWQIKCIGDTICIIDDTNNDLSEEENAIPYDEIYGIPLSEEWLLKFGFAQHLGTNNGWHYGLNPVTDDYYVFIKKTSKGFIFQNGGHLIQYVHQLQNLCHALTGEELTA